MRRRKTAPVDGDHGRGTTISDLEAAIASRWHLKDASLQISSLPKTLQGFFAEFDIFVTDGEWIRNNLDVTFGTGGHGLVHSFIPLHELWVDPILQPWPTIAFHEAVEFDLMLNQNMDYDQAHVKAMQAEHATRVTEGNLAEAIRAYQQLQMR